MSPETYIRQSFDIKIDDHKPLIRMGFRGRPEELLPSVRSAYEEEKGRLFSLLRPAACYTILDYSETNQNRVFKDAEKVALCVCTIGPKLEEEATRLMGKGDMLRGLILDSFGSEATARVSFEMDRFLAAKSLEMGLWPSKRYAPGYRGWHLSDQAFLFRMVGADAIGVRLTDSFMMVPRKSYSFRINFYREKRLTTRKLRS